MFGNETMGHISNSSGHTLCGIQMDMDNSRRLSMLHHPRCEACLRRNDNIRKQGGRPYPHW